MTHLSLRSIRLKTLLWPITGHDKLLEPGHDTSLGSIRLKTTRAKTLNNIHDNIQYSIFKHGALTVSWTCECGMTLFSANHKA
jgi:hypothetical protein